MGGYAAESGFSYKKIRPYRNRDGNISAIPPWFSGHCWREALCNVLTYAFRLTGEYRPCLLAFSRLLGEDFRLPVSADSHHLSALWEKREAKYSFPSWDLPCSLGLKRMCSVYMAREQMSTGFLKKVPKRKVNNEKCKDCNNRCFLFPEPVAHTPHCFDIFRLGGGGFDLFPDPVHVDGDRGGT